jgi:hypothetical protein
MWRMSLPKTFVFLKSFEQDIRKKIKEYFECPFICSEPIDIEMDIFQWQKNYSAVRSKKAVTRFTK